MKLRHPIPADRGPDLKAPCGLSLAAASQVVHFDRWWHPAVESQATDRAFRIGQKRKVLVCNFACRGRNR
jgi:SNF2 family DNA or RNA helicase